PGSRKVDKYRVATGSGPIQSLLGGRLPYERGALRVIEWDRQRDRGDHYGGDRTRPARRPSGKTPTGDGQHQEAAEQESHAVGALPPIFAAWREVAIDIRQPDHGRKED